MQQGQELEHGMSHVRNPSSEGGHRSPRAHSPAPPAPAPHAGCPIYQATYIPAPDGMADSFLPQDSLFTKILTCL